MHSKYLSFAIIIVLAFSVIQLSSSNSTFSETLQPCCNLDYCTSLDMNCGDYTSAQFWEFDCSDQTITCRQCVDYTVSGCLCSGGSQRCKENNGSYYYGNHVSCSTSK